MDNNNDFDIFFILGVLSDVLQIANYEQNIKQTSNDELMNEIDTKTTMILEKIQLRLDTIESKLDKIIKGV